MVCLLVMVATGRTEASLLRSGLVPLGVLFGLTSVCTRLGRGRKERAGLGEARRGRGAAQVVANLGAAGLFASPGFYALLALLSEPRGRDEGFVLRVVATVVLGCLAEATADTVSSEIGQAFGGEPFLLTTLRRVPAGTDGAVSVTGTLAGVSAAGVVVASGLWAMHSAMRGRDGAISLCAGVAGFGFDSWLGATAERKGWLGNDLVNFSATVVAGGMALGAALLL